MGINSNKIENRQEKNENTITMLKLEPKSLLSHFINLLGKSTIEVLESLHLGLLKVGLKNNSNPSKNSGESASPWLSLCAA